MRKIFQNSRRVTINVDNILEKEIRRKIWQLIDLSKVQRPQLSSIQTFSLQKDIMDGVEIQKIIQKQNNPYFEREYLFHLDGVVPKDQITVWVIDDGEYTVMLFPDEY